MSDRNKIIPGHRFTLQHFTVGVLLLLATEVCAAGPILDGVKSREYLRCGVNISPRAGFSSRQADGRWVGIDVDFCRGVAAAVLGNASKVRYFPLTSKDRLTSLKLGTIDILSRNTTWTLSRDASLDITFAGVLFFDGQGFMVPNRLNVNTPVDLKGSSVCVLSDTTTQLNLKDYSDSNRLSIKPLDYTSAEKAYAAYDSGKCQAITGDRSALYAWRRQLKVPNEHKVLPHFVSKEPLGPAVRNGDDDWFKIVRWTLFAFVNAEELGITSKNIGTLRSKSKRPDVKRFLGTEGTLGKDLGLTNTWAYNIIKQVGNYGEIFDRNLGSKSDLKYRRGVNALWDSGGLQYAPPFR